MKGKTIRARLSGIRREYGLQAMKEKLVKNQFIFEELCKRDFKKKYKGTVLGMGWSILAPLLTLLVMKLVFTQFFGRNAEHYTIYLFSGNLILNYYREATKGGMTSLYENARIFTKINVPKYLFLLSRISSATINFLLTLIIYFMFVAADGIAFHIRFLSLVYPVICLTVFIIGVGMVLSALCIFFRDIQYLYDVFLTLLTYVSAIFYTVDAYPLHIQRLFLLNPVYVYIKYFRVVVINGNLPSPQFHLLCFAYAAAALFAGAWLYKKKNQKFLYYV